MPFNALIGPITPTNGPKINLPDPQPLLSLMPTQNMDKAMAAAIKANSKREELVANPADDYKIRSFKLSYNNARRDAINQAESDLSEKYNNDPNAFIKGEYALGDRGYFGKIRAIEDGENQLLVAMDQAKLQYKEIDKNYQADKEAGRLNQVYRNSDGNRIGIDAVTGLPVNDGDPSIQNNKNILWFNRAQFYKYVRQNGVLNNNGSVSLEQPDFGLAYKPGSFSTQMQNIVKVAADGKISVSTGKANEYGSSEYSSISNVKSLNEVKDMIWDQLTPDAKLEARESSDAERDYILKTEPKSITYKDGHVMSSEEYLRSRYVPRVTQELANISKSTSTSSKQTVNPQELSFYEVISDPKVREQNKQKASWLMAEHVNNAVGLQTSAHTFDIFNLPEELKSRYNSNLIIGTTGGKGKYIRSARTLSESGVITMSGAIVKNSSLNNSVVVSYDGAAVGDSYKYNPNTGEMEHHLDRNDGKGYNPKPAIYNLVTLATQNPDEIPAVYYKDYIKGSYPMGHKGAGALANGVQEFTGVDGKDWYAYQVMSPVDAGIDAGRSKHNTHYVEDAYKIKAEQMELNKKRVEAQKSLENYNITKNKK